MQNHMVPLTGLQRGQLYERYAPSVVKIAVLSRPEPADENENEDTSDQNEGKSKLPPLSRQLYAGVVVQGNKILTTSLKPVIGHVTIDHVTICFHGQNYFREATIAYENGIITILRPNMEANQEMPPPVTDLASSIGDIRIGMEVYGFSYAKEDALHFLHGQVSKPRVKTNYAYLKNTHATCLGGPIFNDIGRFVGIFIDKAAVDEEIEFEVMLGASAIGRYLDFCQQNQ